MSVNPDDEEDADAVIVCSFSSVKVPLSLLRLCHVHLSLSFHSLSSHSPALHMRFAARFFLYHASLALSLSLSLTLTLRLSLYQSRRVSQLLRDRMTSGGGTMAEDLAALLTQYLDSKKAHAHKRCFRA